MAPETPKEETIEQIKGISGAFLKLLNPDSWDNKRIKNYIIVFLIILWRITANEAERNDKKNENEKQILRMEKQQVTIRLDSCEASKNRINERIEGRYDKAMDKALLRGYDRIIQPKIDSALNKTL